MLLKPLTYTQAYDFLIANQMQAKNLYFEQKYTSRALAQHFNVFFNAAFQKACFNCLGSKNMGWGGARNTGKKTQNKQNSKRTGYEIVMISLKDSTKKTKISDICKMPPISYIYRSSHYAC